MILLSEGCPLEEMRLESERSWAWQNGRQQGRQIAVKKDGGLLLHLLNLGCKLLVILKLSLGEECKQKAKKQRGKLMLSSLQFELLYFGMSPSIKSQIHLAQQNKQCHMKVLLSSFYFTDKLKS